MPTSFGTAGSLNGTTEVLLQAHPDQGSLLIRELFIHNRDTADVVLTLYITGDYPLFRGTLEPGDTLQLAHHDIIVLNTSTDLFAKLDGTAATTNPSYVLGLAYENEV